MTSLPETPEGPAPGTGTVRTVSTVRTVRTVSIGPEDADARLERWLRRRFPKAPYALVQKWLRTGQVRLNGGRARPGQRLQRGRSRPPSANGRGGARHPSEAGAAGVRFGCRIASRIGASP